ncbi:MAG: MalY/PatB family protein [Bacteroidota bacterium]
MKKKYNFDEVLSRQGTDSIKYDLREKLFGNSTVLPMWVADMEFRTPDFVMEAIRKRAEHEILGYTLRPDSFYEAIINWNRRKHGWDIKREWISFSPGVVPAVNMAIMAFSEPGDEVIVQPPVYHPFFSAITNNDRKILENPLKEKNSRFVMDFDDLESKITDRTKMILLSSPHNPGGTVWYKEELEKLGEICRNNNIIIVSDEIHADLVLYDNKHTPLASISPEIADITLTAMAPSKTFNLAALATSYVVASNPEILNKFNKVLEQVHIGMGNVFGAVALEAAYNYGSEWLEQLLDYLEDNIDYTIGFVNERIPGVSVMIPEATYLVLLDFRELNLSNQDLKDLMIHTAGVAMNDGASFGKQGDGYQRLNVACPRAMLQEALQRIEKAVKKIR